MSACYLNPKILFVRILLLSAVSLFYSLIGPPSLAHADAYRCRSSTGQTTISSSPCSENQRITSVIPSYSQDERGLRQAQSDLERQKQWLKQRELSQQPQPLPVPISNSRRPTGDAYDPDGRDRIHACLMSVTARSGLSAIETGQRRVNCYRGTSGLQDECEMRVTGTAGLTSHQEQSLRHRCRSFSG